MHKWTCFGILLTSPLAWTIHHDGLISVDEWEWKVIGYHTFAHIFTSTYKSVSFYRRKKTTSNKDWKGPGRATPCCSRKQRAKDAGRIVQEFTEDSRQERGVPQWQGGWKCSRRLSRDTLGYCSISSHVYELCTDIHIRPASPKPGSRLCSIVGSRASRISPSSSGSRWLCCTVVSTPTNYPGPTYRPLWSDPMHPISERWTQQWEAAFSVVISFTKQ